MCPSTDRRPSPGGLAPPAPAPPAPGKQAVSDGPASSSAYLERQRALLYHMLTVTREQRRCLIEGDLKGLEETNRLLGSLLDTQQALHREPRDPDDVADPSALSASLLEELHCLAHQLRQESRTNYLLACRGAAFANLSVSLLVGSNETEAGPPDLPSSRPHLMDQPA